MLQKSITYSYLHPYQLAIDAGYCLPLNHWSYLVEGNSSKEHRLQYSFDLPFHLLFTKQKEGILRTRKELTTFAA